MKKILSIALVLGFSIGLTACEKENPTDYYEKLRQECQQKNSESCCLSSVDKMESAHAHQVSPDGECDYGYKKNLLRCIDSFAWCEKEEIKDNGKFAYYEKLRENCETKADKECCLTSVEDMEQVGAQEKITEECPKGTHMNGLLCLSSYQWCEESQNEKVDPDFSENIVCTQEAKQCPDGTFVGRTGPKCEFAKCPIKNSAKNEKIPANCKTWYDGCNNCGVKNGELTFCTKRACFQHETPKCLEFE